MSDDRPPLQGSESTPAEPLTTPEPGYRTKFDAASLQRAAERHGASWTEAIRLLKLGMSAKSVFKTTGINRDLLAALRDSLGLEPPTRDLVQYHAKKRREAAMAEWQNQQAHERSVQALAKQSTQEEAEAAQTLEKATQELSREGSSDPQRVKVDTVSDILLYRNMLKDKIPLAKRARAWAELVSQDKNLIAKLRALELTDELCGYSAPKGAVNEAPLFQLEISQQVSVQPPEPKT